MLFLSEVEKKTWAEYAREITGSSATPVQYEERVRANLLSAFDYYIGSQLALQGQNTRSVEWLEAGTMCEEDGLFSSTFLLSFLARHNGKIIKPAVAFADPPLPPLCRSAHDEAGPQSLGAPVCAQHAHVRQADTVHGYRMR